MAKNEYFLDYRKAVAHAEYTDGDCAGIFMLIANGEIVCNECLMPISKLFKQLSCDLDESKRRETLNG
jgi:hypothetical protein